MKKEIFIEEMFKLKGYRQEGNWHCFDEEPLKGAVSSEGVSYKIKFSRTHVYVRYRGKMMEKEGHLPISLLADSNSFKEFFVLLGLSMYA